MNINNMASIIGDKSIKKEYLSLKRNILDNEDKIESILRKLQIEIDNTEIKELNGLETEYSDDTLLVSNLSDNISIDDYIDTINDMLKEVCRNVIGESYNTIYKHQFSVDYCDSIIYIRRIH